MTDMDGHRVLHPEGLLPPHGPVDPLGGEDGAGVLHEQPEDLILPRGEGNRLPIQGDLLGPVVQGHPAQTQGRGPHRATPQLEIAAQLGLHPGQNLHRVKRLCNIVVRPHIQAQNLVRVLRLGGEQDHRHIGLLPQPGHGGNAVQLGHHNVQQDQVNVLLLQQGQGFGAVIGGEDLVAAGGEVDGQCGHNVLFVVTD